MSQVLKAIYFYIDLLVYEPLNELQKMLHADFSFIIKINFKKSLNVYIGI